MVPLHTVPARQPNGALPLKLANGSHLHAAGAAHFKTKPAAIMASGPTDKLELLLEEDHTWREASGGGREAICAAGRGIRR